MAFALELHVNCDGPVVRRTVKRGDKTVIRSCRAQGPANDPQRVYFAGPNPANTGGNAKLFAIPANSLHGPIPPRGQDGKEHGGQINHYPSERCSPCHSADSGSLTEQPTLLRIAVSYTTPWGTIDALSQSFPCH
jgi:hypothetical protein